MQIVIELSPELAEAGITHTIAKQEYAIGSPKKEISIYLMSSQVVECTLIAKAYNAENQEIGRATTDVQFTRDDAQYISFAFPSEMDSQTVKLYKVAIKPNAP